MKQMDSIEGKGLRVRAVDSSVLASLRPAESQELSGEQLIQLVGRNTRIVKYPDLQHFTDIEELLPKDMSFFILFFETTGKQCGHWQCLFRRGTVFHFFDPYGLTPAGDKRYVSVKILKRLNEFKPYLTNLIKKSVAKGRQWSYNTIRYEAFNSAIETCGRHVAVRLIHRKLDDEAYYNTLRRYIDAHGLETFDDAVTAMTM